MKLTNVISEQIWHDRYCKNNETLDQQLHRVADACANGNEEEAKEFFRILDNSLFLPAGRTMSNLGLGKAKLTLNNCFTLNSIPDDMEGIFDRVKSGALVHKGGGGSGYDASSLRPNGTPTNNDAIASGPISFLKVFDAQTATVNQGSRRGANMGVLNIYHPDIEEFIYAKSKDANVLKYFNLSVMVDDDFMKAKNNNEDIYLHYPVYDEKGKIIKDETKWEIKKKINAKELWDKIMHLAYDNGEPGVLFYDNMNRLNPTNYMENIICTNPCGEYISGVLFGDKIKDHDDYWGACNLGSLVVYSFVENPYTSEAKVNWDLLKDTIYWATRFLDNIIDINYYPIDKFKNYQKNMRVIGMGVMGLATMFTMLGLVYGSDESVEFTEKLMNFISKNIMRASIKLAKEKGSAPFLNKEKYVNTEYFNDMINKDKDWINIKNDILKFGIRNLRHMSIAPNGTISLAYGNNCSSGLEPIFSLEYDRKVKIGGQEEENTQIITMRDYGYNIWLNTPNKSVSKDVFVTALDLPVMSHLKVLKALTAYVNMSASKTINIPTEYSFEETKDVYDYCHKNGIKGCTIFRPNEIRQGILLKKEEKKSDEEVSSAPIVEVQESPEETTPIDKSKEVKQKVVNEQIIFNRITPVAREEFGTTLGTTNKYKTACGSLWITINRDQEGNLIEVFINTSKAGICKSNIDAIGRLVSSGLRAGITVDSLIDQIQGIQCQACRGEIAKGVRLDGLSCPDIVSKALKQEYNRDELVLRKSRRVFKVTELDEPVQIQVSINKNEPSEEVAPENLKHETLSEDPIKGIDPNLIGKRYCPECGKELVSQGGCVVCITGCGWSKCS